MAYSRTFGLEFEIVTGSQPSAANGLPSLVFGLLRLGDFRRGFAVGA